MLKQLFYAVSLCAVLSAAVSGTAVEDSTAVAPGDTGTITTDPESGDSIIKLAPRPPAVQSQQEFPVYVYPQAGRPGPHPVPPRKPAPHP